MSTDTNSFGKRQFAEGFAEAPAYPVREVGIEPDPRHMDLPILNRADHACRRNLELNDKVDASVAKVAKADSVPSGRMISRSSMKKRVRRPGCGGYDRFAHEPHRESAYRHRSGRHVWTVDSRLHPQHAR